MKNTAAVEIINKTKESTKPTRRPVAYLHSRRVNWKILYAIEDIARTRNSLPG